MNKYRRIRNASASVEFCITLPLYLVVMYGVMFFGQVTFIDQEMVLARTYATFNRGRDIDADLNLNVLSGLVGQLNVQALGASRTQEVRPTQDLDGNGRNDRYVDRVEGRPLPLDASNQPYEYSNFNQFDANEAWSNYATSQLEYTYAPDFVKFIYASNQLSQREYLTYNYTTRNVTTRCRDCHGSMVPADNHRMTSFTYRSNPGFTAPTPGQERNLWNYLKVRDMAAMVGGRISGSTPTDPMPPADLVDTGASTQLYEDPAWDNTYVVQYPQP